MLGFVLVKFTREEEEGTLLDNVFWIFKAFCNRLYDISISGTSYLTNKALEVEESQDNFTDKKLQKNCLYYFYGQRFW